MPTTLPNPATSRSALAQLDQRLYEAMARFEAPAVLDRAVPRLSNLANHGGLWVAVSLVAALTGGRKGRRGALRGMLALGVVSALVNGPLKGIVRRPRPTAGIVPEVRALLIPRTTSFPSGHSASAAAFAAGMAIEAPLLAVPVIALAAGVAVSRVYTGVHYPGDVIAGVAIGATAGALSTRLWPRADDGEPTVGARTWARPDEAHVAGAGELQLVTNPESGPDLLGGISPGDLRDAFPQAQVHALGEHDDLVDELRAAAAAGTALGMSGGDGSLNAAAGEALRAGVPLVVVPGGTFNHFARDLGIDSLAAARAAVEGGELALVDVATMQEAGAGLARSAGGNGRTGTGAAPLRDAGEPDDASDVDGRLLLNTASIGSYVRFVQLREGLEPRIGKWAAMAVALVRVLRDDEPIDVELDGVPARVWMVFVGNCSYEPKGFAPAGRARLDDGLLDVRIARGDAPFARLRIVGATLLGRAGLSGVYSERLVSTLRVASADGRPLAASCDGEVFEAPAAVEFGKRRRALRVFVPPQD